MFSWTTALYGAVSLSSVILLYVGELLFALLIVILHDELKEGLHSVTFSLVGFVPEWGHVAITWVCFILNLLDHFSLVLPGSEVLYGIRGDLFSWRKWVELLGRQLWFLLHPLGLR